MRRFLSIVFLISGILCFVGGAVTIILDIANGGIKDQADILPFIVAIGSVLLGSFAIIASFIYRR